MLESRIHASISTEGLEKHLMLPDRLSINKATRDKIWGSIFSNRKKLKEVADDLTKSRFFEGIPRKVIRALEPEDIVSQILSSRESRYNIFGDDLGFDYDDWLGLVMGCHERLSKKLVDGIEDLGFDFTLYDINLEPSESKDLVFLKTLKLYALESNFTKLTFEERDLADFVVNAILGEVGDFQFIVDFMEKYPWCAERNGSFMKGVRLELKEALEDEKTSGTARPECGKRFESFLMNSFRHLSKTMTPGERMTLPNLLSMSKIAVELLGHETFGMPVQLQESLNHQQTSLVEYIDVALKFANSTPGFVAKASFARCNELASEPVVPFVIHSPLSSDALRVLGNYAERMGSHNDAISQFPEALNDELAEFRRLKEEVSVVANAENMDIDALVIKSAQLKEHNDKIHDLAEKVGEVFLAIFESFSQLRAELSAVQEPVAAEVEPVVTEVVVDESLHKLEAAAEAITTLESENGHLNDLLSSAKKEIHTLKLRIDSTQEQPAGTSTALVLDQSTILNLMNRTRKVTPVEILTVFQAMVPERIVVLPSAIESAKKAENFELGPRLAVLMEKLVFTYLDSINAGKPDSEARKVFSQAYAAKESETVTSNKRLRAMREFTYKGEKILFLQHVGVGRNYGTQHAINMYFKIIDEMVIIGWCGEHLETAGTN
jgi:hypothetical protein